MVGCRTRSFSLVVRQSGGDRPRSMFLAYRSSETKTIWLTSPIGAK